MIFYGRYFTDLPMSGLTPHNFN